MNCWILKGFEESVMKSVGYHEENNRDLVFEQGVILGRRSRFEQVFAYQAYLRARL
jgi:hypothetical protein